MSNIVKLSRAQQNHLKYSNFLNNFPRLSLGSLLTGFICIILMVAATFTLIPVGLFDSQIIHNPLMYFSSLDNIIITLHSHLYSPQIPVAIFVGALLGPRLGAMAITGYVGLGLLGLPIFSAGGGLSYVFEPTFGFILAFIAGAFVVGTILSKKINSFNIIFAVLTGVFTIHVLGLAYLIPNLYLAGKSMAFIKAWAVGLSFINLPYDVLLGIVFCALARPIRGLLWLALD